MSDLTPEQLTNIPRKKEFPNLETGKPTPAARFDAEAFKDAAFDPINALRAEIDALRAEVERLRGALDQCQRMAAEGIWVPPCAERWLERIEEVAGAGRAMPDIGDLDRPHPAVIRATAAEADAAAARDQVRKLREALHDAINRPKGVAPDSALPFYDANLAARREPPR